MLMRTAEPRWITRPWAPADGAKSPPRHRILSGAKKWQERQARAVIHGAPLAVGVTWPQRACVVRPGKGSICMTA